MIKKRMKNLPLKFVCVKDQWQNLVKLQKKKHREERRVEDTDKMQLQEQCIHESPLKT